MNKIKPTIITAVEQTKGKGTMGKKWVSKKGNLFVSIFFQISSYKIKFQEFSILNAQILRSVLNKYSNAKVGIDPSKLITVAYEDLIIDPIGTAKSIYNQFNLELDIKTENSMLDYLTKSTGGYKKKHDYSPEDFGLTNELIRNELIF